jgi:hypothetical protein
MISATIPHALRPKTAPAHHVQDSYPNPVTK